MLRPYDLLENILIDIEEGIGESIFSDILAVKYDLTERHLRRLFKFAFKQPVAGYIRSRKLAASLDDLLKTDSIILDIALKYGFCYEQSYINAFKHEFGITPGSLRKSGHIVKVKPPFHLFDENKFSDGVLFGPDIVMVPQFHVIGKLHRITFDNLLTLVPEVTIQFLENERSKINNAVTPNIFYAITLKTNFEEKHGDYLTSVQVADLKSIPEGFCGDTFETSLCARFRYIGKHPNPQAMIKALVGYRDPHHRITSHYDSNNDVFNEMFKKICEFVDNERVKYNLMFDKVQFTKIDTSLFDGTYCQLEWFTPITENRENVRK